MNKTSSIRKKLIITFITILLITSIVLSVVGEIGLIILRQKSETSLINQALYSAEAYVAGKAETISEQIDGVVSKITQIADFTEYIYEHPEQFPKREIPTTFTVPDDAVGNQIYWLHFDEGDENNQEVIDDAYTLANLEGEFQSLMENCSMIQSLYVASEKHVNIGYDSSFITKRDYGLYNPVTAEAQWYLNPLKTGGTYISDTYSDVFNRGLMITISVPYKVNGNVAGVIGADISITNISDIVLDIGSHTEDSLYGMLFSVNGDPICSKDFTEETVSADILGGAENAEKLNKSEKGSLEANLDGENVYVTFNTVDATGWKLAVVQLESEIIAPAVESNHLIFIINIIFLVSAILIFVIMLIRIYRQANKLSEPLISLSNDVIKIGEGNLDYESKIKTGDEIQILSDSFEKMTKSLKTHIENLTAVTAEKERIGAELDVAKNIQASMLPCIFPAFPDRKELDIYATMTPAKEVGGDFYDFFMVDDKHVAIVMADVSGKGVPAALFMVIGKTLIKDHTQLNSNLDEVFTEVNNLLCEANSEGLFITAFEGVLDLETGDFDFVNAGHEMPFIYRRGEGYKPEKIRPGFVLAGMENMKYKSGSVKLNVGDKIFQYTDGVTEATNSENELYGMQRLDAVLNASCNDTPEQTLNNVRYDIDKFVGDAPQFDDITMLCLEYKEKYENKNEQ